jgi:hypothetical protein
MSACSLSDVHLLGPESPPATYKYGSDRKIDFMLGSPNLSDSVRRAGFLAFDDGIFSKHRGSFVDFDFTNLMGPTSAITSSKARLLRSEDQAAADKYIAAFHQYADDHNIWNRVNELATVASTLSMTQCALGYDAIDCDITRAMLHADELARRPSGKYAWSPKLRKAGLLARYWRLCLREVEHGHCLRAPILAIKTRLKSLKLNIVDDDLSDDANIIKPR